MPRESRIKSPPLNGEARGQHAARFVVFPRVSVEFEIG